MAKVVNLMCILQQCLKNFKDKKETITIIHTHTQMEAFAKTLIG